jgi:rubrerythrin
MHTLPPGAPATLNEAFAYIGAVTAPSIDDLKLMVVLEAAGKGLYDDLAAGVEDEAVRALLARNGREELAHAHRVSRAIGTLTEADYPVPAPAENPYLTGPAPKRAVDRAVLMALAEAEFAGENLYERWAANCANPEAAALFRQNGREETEHGLRLQQAANLLAA